MTLSTFDRILTKERLWQYPLALFLATIAIYLVSVARTSNLIEPNGQIVGRDYFAFFMAGDMVAKGQLDLLYDFGEQQLYQRQFMQDINPRWTRTCLYLNPPHYAWLMSLISPLGYGRSLLMWWLISLACFAITALIWYRWLKRRQISLTIMLVVCSPAWFQAFAGGQNTFISLLILTVFCDLLMKKREGWAGLVLSLLAFKFQLLMLPVTLLLLKRRWRALEGVLAGGMLTLGLTLAMLGPQAIIDYLSFGAKLSELMHYKGFDTYKQYSWLGFFELIGTGWMPTISIRILALTASISTLAILVHFWRGSWSTDSPWFPLQLGGLTIAMLVTSPHLFHYDMLIITLPAVLWLRVAHQPEVANIGSAIKSILALGFIALAVVSPIAALVPFQPIPILMLCWLVTLARARQEAPVMNAPLPQNQTCLDTQT